MNVTTRGLAVEEQSARTPEAPASATGASEPSEELTALRSLREVLAKIVPYQAAGRSRHRVVSTLVAGLIRHERLGPDGPLLVLLFGGANTGKSTVFNSLAGSDVSVVKAIAGTTCNVLAYAPEALLEELQATELWPEPFKTEPMGARELLIADLKPRRIFLKGHQDPSLTKLVVADAPDMTTALTENAAIAGQVLLLADIVLLVLTEEQHADKVMIDHFPNMRDLAKTVKCIFNRVGAGKGEELGAFQKFRMIWLENRMGAMPDRFFLPRVPPGDVATKLRDSAPFKALKQHLAGIDGRDLKSQSQTGLMVALRQKGNELVEHVEIERQQIRRAIDELNGRYRRTLEEYNTRRRWASRMLTVRSWLQTTVGEVYEGLTADPKAAHPKDMTAAEQQKFWQLLVTPLMARPDRPSALEGLEIMGAAMENDPNPAPFYRPFSRLAKGMSHLIFGQQTIGQEGDSTSLIDALELLEKARCHFVASEVLSRSLEGDWKNAVSLDSGSFPGEPASTVLARRPQEELEAIAREYRQLAEDLRQAIMKVMLDNPGIRARLSQRNAKFALTAGIALALALIDMGQSALAFGVGMGAPLLWELMDWAANRPELNEELKKFAAAKARWFERSFQRHVTGAVYDHLIQLERRLDPNVLRAALQHATPGSGHA